MSPATKPKTEPYQTYDPATHQELCRHIDEADARDQASELIAAGLCPSIEIQAKDKQGVLRTIDVIR